ncbi:MAG: response regulator transcription factor [Actinobacteria bacterium]|nr:response regulator transcription factor [Actinomycetota bacterium]MBO0786242.1 response regulator transcription factor [Actinomycetota bacterium]
MTDGQPIRVVLVDDQPLVRAGLRAILQRAPDIVVAGEAADGRSGVSEVRAHRPDVVLMDIRMPGVDGITATETIVADRQLDGVRVVMLTTYDTDEHIFDAIAAGAAGFLLKDTAAEDLRAAVRVVASGDALLSPAVTTRVLRRVGSDARHARTSPDAAALLGQLTEREREVLQQVGRGLSNDEIAKELFISPATARTYVSRLLSKLHARDRAGLVVIAYETGLR